jgi:hypothetical protein
MSSLSERAGRARGWSDGVACADTAVNGRFSHPATEIQEPARCFNSSRRDKPAVRIGYAHRLFIISDVVR